MTSAPTTAYPLCWPPGHQRTSLRLVSQFATAKKAATLATVLAKLQDELDRLHARDVILSTNLPTRVDGLPRSGIAQPEDPGVALYFTLKGKALVLPCDKWRGVSCNIMAIVKHIEALRGLERWGVGTVERAFDGYAALPEKAVAETCWNILGVERTAPKADIKARFRALAQQHHPDKAGGSKEFFYKLSDAYEQAKRERPDLI